METGNLGRQVVRRILQNVSETWEVRDSQFSKEPSINKMSNRRDRENIEPTSSRKKDRASNAGEGVRHPHSHNSDP